MREMTLNLPDATAETIESAVRDGRFADAGEVVAAALHDWSAADFLSRVDPGKLATFLERGLDSGPSIPAEAFFADLRTRYRDR